MRNKFQHCYNVECFPFIAVQNINEIYSFNDKHYFSVLKSLRNIFQLSHSQVDRNIKHDAAQLIQTLKAILES